METSYIYNPDKFVLFESHITGSKLQLIHRSLTMEKELVLQCSICNLHQKLQCVIQHCFMHVIYSDYLVFILNVKVVFIRMHHYHLPLIRALA